MVKFLTFPETALAKEPSAKDPAANAVSLSRSPAPPGVSERRSGT